MVNKNRLLIRSTFTVRVVFHFSFTIGSPYTLFLNKETPTMILDNIQT